MVTFGFGLVMASHLGITPEQLTLID
jgi:hypothetical protein